MDIDTASRSTIDPLQSPPHLKNFFATLSCIFHIGVSDNVVGFDGGNCTFTFTVCLTDHGWVQSVFDDMLCLIDDVITELLT